MIEFLLATALNCAESKEVIESVKGSRESDVDKQELIKVIKTNTEPECYEGSEHNS
tara:strand:- start:159 stop:326 length:168 start_codon:yes stop_codon:yes gene_type:complete